MTLKLACIPLENHLTLYLVGSSPPLPVTGNSNSSCLYMVLILKANFELGKFYSENIRSWISIVHCNADSFSSRHIGKVTLAAHFISVKKQGRWLFSEFVYSY